MVYFLFKISQAEGLNLFGEEGEQVVRVPYRWWSLQELGPTDTSPVQIHKLISPNWEPMFLENARVSLLNTRFFKKTHLPQHLYQHQGWNKLRCGILV